MEAGRLGGSCPNSFCLGVVEEDRGLGLECGVRADRVGVIQAEKFSGSCGSYLITKACDTEQEAASVICQIGEEVLELNPKVGGVNRWKWGVGVWSG